MILGGGPRPRDVHTSGVGVTRPEAGRTGARPDWTRLASLAVFMLAACGPTSGPNASGAASALVRLGDPEVGHAVIDRSLDPDPSVDAIIRPYRAEYEAWAVEVVGQSGGVFSRGDPEATLDNLVADALLASARRLSRRPVDMAMLNDGGLRADIDEGPVDLSEIFELMPFENTVTIIDLTGHQVDTLAYQIARTRGEPVAGIRFGISSEPTRAFDIRIGGELLDPDRTYRLALADYLANGAGNWPQVWTPVGREDFTYLIRDAILEYVRERDVIEPYLDGRIRVGSP